MTCTSNNSCYDQDKNFQKLYEHNCEGDCPSGWSKGGANKCQCCVDDWETATLNLWGDGKTIYHDTTGRRIADVFKTPCCLGYNGGFDRSLTCSPKWCPSDQSKSCENDPRIQKYCMDQKNYPMSGTYDNGCDVFCSVAQPNGLERKHDPSHWCHKAIRNFCAEDDPSRVTPANPICTDDRYDCTGGSCQRKVGGRYLADPKCAGQSCELPLYFCNNGQCAIVKTGDKPSKTYESLSKCHADCKPMKYVCKDGLCSEDPAGKYDNKGSCLEGCMRYKCVDKKCVQTEGGPFKNYNDCNETCGVDPVKPKTYDCVKGQCTFNTEGTGKFSSKICDGTCELAKDKYGCDGTLCKKMDDGEYEDANCLGKCIPTATKYDCDKDGKCVVNAGGRFYSDDCGKTCAPPQNDQTKLIIGGGIGFIVFFLLIIFLIRMRWG